jgi:carbamoyl-phosphate synthase small subunit
MDARLILEDGRIFRGKAQGGLPAAEGEVVFNTSMSGYQEILTDPSYRGQIVAMTCPHIGNVGVNSLDRESASPQVAGFVVRELSVRASNWRSTQNLPEYLLEHGIPCVSGIDTRALTRHLRSRGAMRGMITTDTGDAAVLIRRVQAITPLPEQNLVAEVACREPHNWNHAGDPHWNPVGAGLPAAERPHCVAFDFGVKHNILRLLYGSGFRVTVVPPQTSATDVLALEPDGIFLSNGPGDPEVVGAPIETVRQLLGKRPMFGICLGLQIAAQALGASTFKLNFGHRGANHPVKDLETGRVAVTSQNHGYAVDPERLPAEAMVTHINLNDETVEGFRHPGLQLHAVQHHPEASPGPHDALPMFAAFQKQVMARIEKATGGV